LSTAGRRCRRTACSSRNMALSAALARRGGTRTHHPPLVALVLPEHRSLAVLYGPDAAERSEGVRSARSSAASCSAARSPAWSAPLMGGASKAAAIQTGTMNTASRP
jgi:hypothetical protein